MSALRRAWLRLRLWDLENQTAAAAWKLEQDELDECLYQARLADVARQRRACERELVAKKNNNRHHGA